MTGNWQDARITSITKFVDGDSVHLHWESDPVDVAYDIQVVARSRFDRPRKCRLIIVDTPERGEVGWGDARTFTMEWLTARAGYLRAEFYYPDNFGRMLTDIYEMGSRGNTLTQALLQAGYEPYVA